MTRIYKTVDRCDLYPTPHRHLEVGETVYCTAAGKWVKPLNVLTPKELHDKWYPKKTKFQRKEERKEAEEK